MEKFSKFRDPGTGIQPFLTPVPAIGTNNLSVVLLPIGILLGTARTALVFVLALLYVLVVQGLCLLLTPVNILHRLVTGLITSILARTVLFVAGVWWVDVEYVSRKRTGRGSRGKETWKPEAGDLIVSNWISWTEILWLAFRFNPQFVLPIATAVEVNQSPSSSPAASPKRPQAGKQSPSTGGSRIIGFKAVSLIGIIRATGRAPLQSSNDRGNARSLEEIRKHSRAPVVLFPECTTSNGRGLLQFAGTLADVRVPVRDYNVFVMSVRVDPPTQFSPTLSHSIPTSPSFLNPLSQIFRISSSIIPQTMSVRLLKPSESPSSETFVVGEFVGEEDQGSLSGICASLISSIGKLKRTGMGWKEKQMFLEVYGGKRKQ